MAKRDLRGAMISAVVGSVAAFATCFVLFFFVFKPAPAVDAKPPADAPSPTPAEEIPNPDIDPMDVKSVTISTVYKGYFEPGDKCAKTYNEYFGNSDGSYSPSSPCSLTLKFDRNGNANRTIDISRWNKTAREKQSVEKTESTASITPAQFDALVKTIVSNEAFRAWRTGTMITVSNCSITVEYSGGTKTVMSNVNENSSVFLAMVDAFKEAEKLSKWK